MFHVKHGRVTLPESAGNLAPFRSETAESGAGAIGYL
jgi:hypothetical protein